MFKNGLESLVFIDLRMSAAWRQEITLKMRVAATLLLHWLLSDCLFDRIVLSIAA